MYRLALFNVLPKVKDCHSGCPNTLEALLEHFVFQYIRSQRLSQLAFILLLFIADVPVRSYSSAVVFPQNHKRWVDSSHNQDMTCFMHLGDSWFTILSWSLIRCCSGWSNSWQDRQCEYLIATEESPRADHSRARLTLSVAAGWLWRDNGGFGCAKLGAKSLSAEVTHTFIITHERDEQGDMLGDFAQVQHMLH